MGINTMHKHNLYVQFCNTNRCKKKCNKYGYKIFNNLPLELKGVADFEVFKRKLKGCLLLSAFYSLQEFFVSEVDGQSPFGQ
jgi:hypothetical protein